MSRHVSFSFSSFVSFLTIFHFLHCAIFIFHLFQSFLPHSRLYSVCASFSIFLYFLAIFHVLQFAFRHFHVFHCFSSQSRSYSVCFSFSTFFKFPRNPDPNLGISHISRFSLFLIKIQILQCMFLIFLVCQCFSPHILSYSVRFSFSSFVSFLAIFQFLQCAIFIFHVFQCFLPHFRLYSVLASFSILFYFLAIYHVIQFAFPHFHVLHCFSSQLDPTVCVSHFLRFSNFSPKSRS